MWFAGTIRMAGPGVDGEPTASRQEVTVVQRAASFSALREQFHIDNDMALAARTAPPKNRPPG